MAVQGETNLQQQIQKLIEKRGGYVNKNHGSMIAEPGIADLTACYRGLYLAIEVKVGSNEPSKMQGIHCRAVQKSNGITIVAWSKEAVETVLDLIDLTTSYFSCHLASIKLAAKKNGVEDGTKY